MHNIAAASVRATVVSAHQLSGLPQPPPPLENLTSLSIEPIVHVSGEKRAATAPAHASTVALADNAAANARNSKDSSTPFPLPSPLASSSTGNERAAVAVAVRAPRGRGGGLGRGAKKRVPRRQSKAAIAALAAASSENQPDPTLSMRLLEGRTHPAQEQPAAQAQEQAQPQSLSHLPTPHDPTFEISEFGDFSLFMSPFYSPHPPQHASQLRLPQRRRQSSSFTSGWDDSSFGDLSNHSMFPEDDMMPKTGDFDGADMSNIDKLTPELVQNTTAAIALPLHTPRSHDELLVPMSPNRVVKRKRTDLGSNEHNIDTE